MRLFQRPLIPFPRAEVLPKALAIIGGLLILYKMALILQTQLAKTGLSGQWLFGIYGALGLAVLIGLRWGMRQPSPWFRSLVRVGRGSATLDQRFSAWARRHVLLAGLAIALFSLLLAIYLVASLLRAEFWVLDNYIITERLADGGLAPQDILRTWWQEEIARAGNSWINRPLYWLLRLAEIGLWGSRAWLYYLDRLVCLAIAIFALTWASISALGLSFGLLLALRTMQLHFWNDIWTWIGPSEAFCAVGLAGIILGLGTALQRYLKAKTLADISLDLPISFVAIGTIIAAGCKENFVFSGLPLAVLTALGLSRSKRVGLGPRLLSALGLLTCLLVSGLVLSYLSQGNEPTEVYGRSIDLISSLMNQVHFFTRRQHLRLSAAILVAIALLLYNLLPRRQASAESRQQRLALGGVLALGLLWSSWEILFYGEFAVDHRYRFPIALLQILVLAVAGINLAAILTRLANYRQQVILRAVGIVLGSLILINQGFPLRAAAISFTQDTQQFMTDLRTLAATVKENPDFPIYVESGATGHDYEQPIAYYEPVASLMIWFRWQGIENPVFLRVAADPDLASLPAFDRSLLADVQRWSVQGDQGYQPMANLDPAQELQGQCYSLSYLAPASTQCKVLRLRWRY